MKNDGLVFCNKIKLQLITFLISDILLTILGTTELQIEMIDEVPDACISKLLQLKQ